MFKKFISMATATILLASGISILGANSAQATTPISNFEVGCSQGPLVGQSTSGVSCRNTLMMAEWSLSNESWSPSVSSTFQANTVYSVTYRATPSFGYTVPNVNANTFTVNTSYAGSPSGTTVTNLAATSGASYITITITFPSLSSGGGGGSTCSSDLLLNTSTIKGVTFTKGTRKASSTDFNGAGSAFMGNVTLTSAEASGNGITSLSASGGASVKWLYISPSINSWSNSDINTTDNLQGVTLASGRLFEIKVIGTGCTDYYRLSITVGSGSNPSQQNAQQIAAAAAASAAYLQAVIAKAKAALSNQFSSNKPATAEQFLDAGYGVRNSAVAEKVSAAILKLPVADRDKSEKINEIINLENFVDRVAVLGTRTSVTSNELISRGLLPADSVNKYSIVQGLANYPDGSLNSMEKIAAAVKAEIVKAGARKAKTEAIKAKIAARRG